MRKEIEEKLTILQIEVKDIRRKTARNVGIVLGIIAVFYILYYYSQLTAIFVINVLIILFGGIYIVFYAIPTLYNPLTPEENAFKKIVRAIEILEKSKESIAYKEAHRCLNKAYKILKNIELNDIEWYDETNQILERFFNNLKLIVLPAVVDSYIQMGHLEEIALAVYEADPDKIKAVNERLELEPNYKKSIVREREITTFMRKVKESMIGKVLFSLAFGYGIILTACLIYVVLTQQDFMTFARERPEIVITGGLLASGITSVTIWKIR